MARVLITGGAGFIGSGLARRLAAAGDQVHVFDNLHPQVHGSGAVPPDLGPGVRFERGDVTDRQALAAAVAASDPDQIFHLAAETGTGQSHDLPARYCDANVMGAAHLVEALRALPERRRRLVLAGSRAVYGEGAYIDARGRPASPAPRSLEAMRQGRFDPVDEAGARLQPVPTHETEPPRPASVYASTKLMQEQLIRQTLCGGPCEPVVLRFQNVYGPGQSLSNPYTGVLSIFSSGILEGRTLNIYEDGAIVRDFVFVDDVVEALVRAAHAPYPGSEPINIGSGQGVTILEVARQLLAALEAPTDRWRISGDFRPGDVRHAVADIARARSLLGWAPTTPLAQGLRRFAQWAAAQSLAAVGPS